MKFPSRSRPIVVTLLMLVSASASAALDPTIAAESRAVVEALHAGLVAAGSGEATREERYAALAPLVTRTHDLAFIAERTIRRLWRDLDETQRSTYLTAFERLSVMTYAMRFRAADQDAFVIHDVLEAGSGRVQVKAAIDRAGSTEIPLDYVLQHSEAGWRIINIVADGVSDLALKRAEYQRVLSAGSFEDLVDYIDEQTRRLE